MSFRQGRRKKMVRASFSDQRNGCYEELDALCFMPTLNNDEPVRKLRSQRRGRIFQYIIVELSYRTPCSTSTEQKSGTESILPLIPTAPHKFYFGVSVESREDPSLAGSLHSSLSNNKLCCYFYL